jgi:Ran-binding protein 3
VCSSQTGDGTLFEFDDEKRQWRERGRGEMRVNVASSGQARIIMRSKGNFRLLLNANLWPEMKVTPMDGGKVSLSVLPGHFIKKV